MVVVEVVVVVGVGGVGFLVGTHTVGPPLLLDLDPELLELLEPELPLLELLLLEELSLPPSLPPVAVVVVVEVDVVVVEVVDVEVPAPSPSPELDDLLPDLPDFPLPLLPDLPE